MDLLANEFARLRGWGFAFALVASRASQGFLLGHCVTSRKGKFTQRPFQKTCLAGAIRKRIAQPALLVGPLRGPTLAEADEQLGPTLGAERLQQLATNATKTT